MSETKQSRRHLRPADLAGLASVVVASLVVQVSVNGRYLDNQVINGHFPAGDATDYVARAHSWLESGFATAFADAFRMPGYPAYLALTTWLAPDNGLFVARVGQVLAMAASCALAYLIVGTYTSIRWRLVAGFTVAAYLPLSFWAPVLIAESWSILLLSVSLYIVSRRSSQGYRIIDLVLLGLTILAMTYMKPNNVIALIPLLLFMGIATEWHRWWRLALVPAIVVLGVAPWIAFASSSQGQLVASSTTSGGITMYWGLGGIPPTSEAPAFQSLAVQLGVFDPSIKPVTFAHGTAAERSAAYTNLVVDTWKQRPFQQFGWSLVKVAHMSGLLPRGPRDVVFATVLVASLISAAILWGHRRLRPWSMLVAATFAMVALQAMIFTGDQRHRTTLYDYPAIIAIVLASRVIATRLAKRSKA